MHGPIWTPNPVNRSHPLNLGRVAWWLPIPGLQGGSTLYDLRGLNPGTLTSMNNANNGWQNNNYPGALGQSILFDGMAGFVRGPAMPSAPSATQKATFIAWVNFKTIASYQVIAISNVPSHNNSMGLFLSGASGNPLTSSWTNTANEYNAATGLNITTGEWTFCAATISGSTIKVFRASASHLFNSATISISATNETLQGPYWMGANNSNATTTLGNNPIAFSAMSLGEFSIFSRALSSAEILQYYLISQQAYPGVLNRKRSMLPQLAGQAPVGVHNPYYYRQLQGAA